MASPSILMPCPLWRRDWPQVRRSLNRAVAVALREEGAEGPAPTLVLADDATVRPLNARFRGKDKPTNVLSFPNEDDPESLGDMIFAYETVVQESLAQGKALAAHATHLAVHGTLHLLGYDHEEEGEAERMEAREIHILAILGIANPYLLA